MPEELFSANEEDAQGKSDSFQELLEPENPGEDLLSGEEWHHLAAQLQLSSREISVAVLLFEGKSRDQIARQLGCSPSTVRVYIDRLFLKLNVRGRVELVLRNVRIHFGRTTTTVQKVVTERGDLREDEGQV